MKSKLETKNVSTIWVYWWGRDTQSREYYAQIAAQVDTQVHVENVYREGPPTLMLMALSFTATCTMWGEIGDFVGITEKLEESSAQ